MKHNLIFPLFFLLFQTGLFAQIEKVKIKVKTDKEVYSILEVVNVTTKSRSKFSLMTDGDCSSSIIYPVLIKEKDGVFPEPESMAQMCCGLPYSQPMKKFESQYKIEEEGRYKVIVYTSSGMIHSNVFVVEK